MSATGGARIHSLREALARLDSPYSQEELASPTGEGVLIVDLPAAGDGRTGPGGTDRARRALRRLACPTIAIAPRDLHADDHGLAAAFDLRLESGDSLAAVLGAIARNPQASLALVQLLRHNAPLDVHEGLIAESLVYSTLQSGGEFARWCAARIARPVPDPARPVLGVERDGATLVLTLDRPERHNAFGVALRDALVEALQLATRDDSIESVVLRGNGQSFCSGGDLDEFGSLPDPATAHAIRSTRHPARWLAGVATRVRAEVHGACIGAGVELPAFAARTVARADAYFQLPEIAMGLVPGAGGTVSLPRRIGSQRTAWLAITGARIDAATALAWGLVDEIA